MRYKYAVYIVLYILFKKKKTINFVARRHVNGGDNRFSFVVAGISRVYEFRTILFVRPRRCTAEERARGVLVQSVGIFRWTDGRISHCVGMTNAKF